MFYFFFHLFGSAFVVPNDILAESITYYTNQVAGLVCNSDQKLNLYVLGDFNMPGLDWENVTGTNCRKSESVEIYADYILMPLELSPTHDKGEILDNILSSTSDYQTHNESNLKCCSISDHYPIPARLCDYETICRFREKTFYY